ncbi:MAG: PIG-L family deacetylase [Actinobacteria bacterium]|nr:PIG-L family deacetylase [Actinomycetota bacterium]MCB9411850.1 PIG-L family deacetylase [Actinomycetota bacterium]
MTDLTVLAVGAHPDDIELGCGATLWRHHRAGAHVIMVCVTDGMLGPGEVAKRQSEAHKAAKILGADLRMLGLSDGATNPDASMVRPIEAILDEYHPQIIYTHAEDDSHQDHRNTASAVISAARNYTTILNFQSPSSRNFSPQLFVGLEPKDLKRKKRALRAHSTQVSNSARVDLSAVDAAAHYWGSQARTTMAEPFEVTRALFGFHPSGRIVRWSPDGFSEGD